MRYALIRFKGKPTERPVGTLDIIGLGHYKTLANAKRYLWDSLFQETSGEISGVDLLKVLAEKGYTHFGLYEVPDDITQPDVLVAILRNPFTWQEGKSSKE